MVIKREFLPTVKPEEPLFFLLYSPNLVADSFSFFSGVPFVSGNCWQKYSLGGGELDWNIFLSLVGKPLLSLKEHW